MNAQRRRWYKDHLEYYAEKSRRQYQGRKNNPAWIAENKRRAKAWRQKKKRTPAG
jgi:hypothetical protein